MSAAVCHGAVTIVNAITTGRGAAMGIGLSTKARVELTDEIGRIRASIAGSQTEDTRLIECCVKHVLRRFGCLRRFGAVVETNSDIPIARGLKSSSAAANAIVLATAASLNKTLSDHEVLNIGVNAAVEAGVTITGAFDDACAAYYGDIAITDNPARQLIARRRAPAGITVLIYVPEMKAYTGKLDTDKLRGIKALASLAHKEARAGNYWNALTLNGLAYGAALGYDSSPTVEALQAGALASGISGKGPAVTAIVREKSIREVREAWSSLRGEIIETRVNRKKACVIR